MKKLVKKPLYAIKANEEEPASEVKTEVIAEETIEAETPIETEIETEVNAEEVEFEEDEESRTFNKRSLVGLIVVLCIVVLAIAAFVIGCEKPADDEKAVVAQQTWQMAASDYGQNRWFAEGIQAIKDAETKEEAMDAAVAWLEEVKKDPALLSAAALSFLHENVDSSTLVKDGWATQEAVKIYGRLGIAVALSAIEVSEAPVTGWNSGVHDGAVVSAANAGISGNRKAIKLTLEDGTVVWVLARCGNIVTPSKPNIPTGPTDELTPKSSDPADYKQPGDDDTTDSGEGTKPPVTVTTPAESKPPVVVTDTKKPAEETDVTAPGATTPDPDRPIPTPEPGTAPDDGEPNDTDPGLPAGF